ncbi:MAG: hypothetical protein JWM19_2424 [Actinomycetia bacterium]|nr:hypothetical protein [Actinomycetes bacterium]
MSLNEHRFDRQRVVIIGATAGLAAANGALEAIVAPLAALAS